MADDIPVTKARLKRGAMRFGWTAWWLVDQEGNLLNTEPVCSTPEDKWHPWFIKLLEEVETPYLGIRSGK